MLLRSFALHLLFVLFVGGAWLGTSLPASAQSPDSTQAQKLQIAEAHLRAGQFDQAIPLLEDLYADQPGSHALHERLKEAYEGVKRYDDALTLVEERLEEQETPALLSEKARLLYLKDEEETARRTWRDAVDLAPDDQNTYRIVYQSLIDARLFTQAIETMQRGREELADSSLFQMELAYLYNLTGEHEKALEEYLQLLSENEGRLNFVQRRLSQFLDQDGALEQSIDAARRAVEQNPENRTYRELAAWLHMEADQYDEALDAYRALDQFEEGSGKALLSFAQKAADAGAYQAALTAYDEILDRYPDSSIAPEALRGQGVVHERWADQLAASLDSADQAPSHYETALDTYQAFLEAYPEHMAYPDVLRRVGRLQQDVFRRLDEAEKSLQEVVRRYPATRAADEAQLDLGRLEIARDNLDEAEETLTGLLERLEGSELAETARYELALLHFYQGQFDETLSFVEAINENVSTDEANDGIELKTLIQINRGPDSTNTPLQRYAEARLLKRQHHFEEARATTEAFLEEYGRHSLADDVRFLRAEVLREEGRMEEALEAFAEIPAMHPESPLADQSLFHAAQLLEREGDAKSAVETYTRLLNRYPGSLLATEARTRLRSLWDDNRSHPN